MDDHLSVAEEAVRDAGDIIARLYDEPREIDYKGPFDLVTSADRQAEELIVGRIRERFPAHGIVAEEGGESKSDSEFRWYVDPLDGTTNFAHGFPMFCVALALEQRGEIVLGVIYDPLRKELYRAVKGQGAYVNDRRMRVSQSPRLDESLLATGFPPFRAANHDLNIQYYLRFTDLCHGVRRAGSASLDLCYLAAGRLDGFWELKLFPWDKAAGGLMVLEAGGKITDMDGGPFKLWGDPIFASNGLIHAEMGDIFSQVKTSHAG